jgi:hypothetical protein
MNAQTRDPTKVPPQINAQIKDLKNLIRAALIKRVVVLMMKVDRTRDRTSQPKEMDQTEKNRDQNVRRKNLAKRRGGLRSALLKSLSAPLQRRVQRSQMNAHQINLNHLRIPKSPRNAKRSLSALNSIVMQSLKGNWTANSRRKLGSLNVMIKRELREVAVQTTKRKGVEAAADIARIILPLSQSILIAPTVTLVILARKMTTKRINLM